MDSFVEFVNSLDLEQLSVCKSIICDAIMLRKCSIEKCSTANINDFIDYRENFVPINKLSLLDAEVEKLNLTNSPSDDAVVQNAYISLVDAHYTWNSKKGPVVNNPVNLEDFPNIKSVLVNINEQFGCDLNSVLVSYFKNGETSLRLHNDDEDTLDSSQPICVVSLGVKRTVQFVKVTERDHRRTCKTLVPKEGSMYVMKAGCQDIFKHRVNKDLRISKSRYSLSFRRRIPPSEQVETVSEPVNPEICKNSTEITSSPTNEIKTSPAKNHMSETDNSVSNFVTPAAKLKTVSFSPSPIEGSDKILSGYSPFTTNSSNLSHSLTTKRNGSKTDGKNAEKNCVILGTSITQVIDGDKLSRRMRKVYNCSYSGARIRDIAESAHEFCADNPGAIKNVDKVIVCVGVNDIKSFNSFDNNTYKRFRSPLVGLINKLKFLFPKATLFFKCVLPMGCKYNYTAKTVHEFNRLLLDLCGRNGCIFFDCFSEFLDKYDGRDIDRYLYRDNLHLNDTGTIVLCRAIKFLIYRDVFNPVMRVNYSPYYYW